LGSIHPYLYFMIKKPKKLKKIPVRLVGTNLY
jgi:hypothetical protein